MMSVQAAELIPGYKNKNKSNCISLPMCLFFLKSDDNRWAMIDHRLVISIHHSRSL